MNQRLVRLRTLVEFSMPFLTHRLQVEAVSSLNAIVGSLMLVLREPTLLAILLQDNLPLWQVGAAVSDFPIVGVVRSVKDLHRFDIFGYSRAVRVVGFNLIVLIIRQVLELATHNRVGAELRFLLFLLRNSVFQVSDKEPLWMQLDGLGTVLRLRLDTQIIVVLLVRAAFPDGQGFVFTFRTDLSQRVLRPIAFLRVDVVAHPALALPLLEAERVRNRIRVQASVTTDPRLLLSGLLVLGDRQPQSLLQLLGVVVYVRIGRAELVFEVKVLYRIAPASPAFDFFQVFFSNPPHLVDVLGRVQVQTQRLC
mmetsp:Transcript_10289/g.15705  ORF Transcript_10289/g.15705 Transcript_10289/m.15705 type:complete len:309 (-) Transcript_10289:592-1518(-)